MYPLSLTRALAALLLVAVLTIATAGPSGAVAIVVVTTTADSVANDGLTSLREAVDLANGDADDTVIQLTAGATYELTICEAKEPIDFGNGFFGAPADDDANADGDLDHTAADDLTIEGNGATIENTCLYDRVIDNLDVGSRLILDDLTVTGGVGAPDQGGNVFSLGGATLTGVTIADSIRDVGNQSGALVVGESSPQNLGNLLTMTDSVVITNGQSGVRVNTGDAVVTGSSFLDNGSAGISVSFGNLVISDTILVDNGTNGINGIDAAIDATEVVAGGNGGYGIRSTGNADSGYDVTVTDSTIVQNGNGGIRCSFCTALDVIDTTVTVNTGTGVSMLANLEGPTMTITGSSITDNTGQDTGFEPWAGGVQMTAIDGPTPTVTISDTTIAGNATTGANDGGAISMTSAGLVLSSSTVTLNTTAGAGGGIATDGAMPVSLDWVTLVENTSAPGQGANLDIGSSDLASTASVIALPGGGADCALTGTVTSGGGNRIDDTTCQLTDPDDVAPTPNPLLGPPAANGGLGDTRLPQAGSPLMGAITGPLCAGAPNDQRGVTRPQGAGCEPGAVEVDESPMAALIAGSDPVPRADRPLAGWLADRGYTVTVIDDDDLDPATIATLDTMELVLISSSVVPGIVGTSLNGVTAPVLSTEGHLFDDLGIASDGGERDSTRNVVVVDPASGFSGYVGVLTAPRPLAWGDAVPSAHVVARAPGGSGGVPVAFTVDAGDPLADLGPAAGPRGAFFFSHGAPPVARSRAFALLDHIVDLLVP